MILFSSLINNISANFNYLRQDFIGIGINFFIIFNLLINILIPVILIIIFYLIGSKIKFLLYKNENLPEQEIFIKIALGYILSGSGLAILGFLSLLSPLIITVYLIIITAVALFPIKTSTAGFIDLKKFTKKLINDFKIHKWIFIWTTLFIFIAFIKLQSPEIREDQYHTDLPVQYLKNHSIMLPSREQIMVSASPQLAEMSYMVAIFIGSKEATRYIHFTFYILVLLVLYSISRDKHYKLTILAPLIFATAPEVIREASSQYTDFQWIFLFLLSVIILTRSKLLDTKLIALSGFIFGGMIATKLWTIAFIAVPLLYILIINYKTKIKATKYIFNFVLFSLIAPSIWFLRSFILTGSPVYPAFGKREILEGTVGFGISNYISFNYGLINPVILKLFSPIFFLGIVIFIYKLKDNLNDLKKNKLFYFFVLLFILYAFINYPYGRYLLGLYSIAVIIVSISLYKIVLRYKLFKYLISVVLFLLFFYYFLNSVLVLPYGIGIADKNKYLTRILSRDNSSYYDFDHKFNKFITKDDFVATYGIFGYYYAYFNYIDVSYIFEKKNMSFGTLKENKITKLFIKNEDVSSFCNKLKLASCTSEKYILISYFSAVPYSGASYYLYEIK
ncbi:MAG: hypothetical protein AAB609_03805 [Patescibacteria group bacterium]